MRWTSTLAKLNQNQFCAWSILDGHEGEDQLKSDDVHLYHGLYWFPSKLGLCQPHSFNSICQQSGPFICYQSFQPTSRITASDFPFKMTQQYKWLLRECCVLVLAMAQHPIHHWSQQVKCVPPRVQSGRRLQLQPRKRIWTQALRRSPAMFMLSNGQIMLLFTSITWV